MAWGADVQNEIDNRIWEKNRSTALAVYRSPAVVGFEKAGIDALFDPSQTGKDMHLYDNVKGAGYALR